MFCDAWTNNRGERILDINIENVCVEPDYQPIAAGFAVAHERQYEMQVADGLLDIDLLSYCKWNADICGLRIERLESVE